MSCNFCDIEPNILCSDHYGSNTTLSECNNNSENHLTKIKLINRSLPKDSQIIDEKAIILLRCGIDIEILLNRNLLFFILHTSKKNTMKSNLLFTFSLP